MLNNKRKCVIHEIRLYIHINVNMIILSNIHSKNICVTGGVSRTTCLSFMFQYVFVSLEIFGFYLLELKEMFRLQSGHYRVLWYTDQVPRLQVYFLIYLGDKNETNSGPVRTSCFRRAELNSGIKFIDLKLFCSSVIYFHSFMQCLRVSVCQSQYF